MPKLKPGRYRHYKGNYYELLGIARHSENSSELAVYKALYHPEGGNLWVRPVDMFCEQVILEGKSVPRFEFIG